jgi:hypothetical protein
MAITNPKRKAEIVLWHGPGGKQRRNIPKGLDLKAQGCREAATLGHEVIGFFLP